MSEARSGGEPRRLETPVEATIRAAIERGEFDNLPGAGQPLPDRGRDENWWVTQYLEREEGSSSGFLPRSLLLRRESQDVQHLVSRMTSETAVRTHVAELNRRIADEIRTPSGGPPLAMRPVDADTVVDGWRADRAARDPLPDIPDAPPGRRTSWWRTLFQVPKDR